MVSNYIYCKIQRIKLISAILIFLYYGDVINRLMTDMENIAFEIINRFLEEVLDK